MAVPAPLGVAASGFSPYGKSDQANAVVQGTIAAVGPAKCFAFRGPLNLFMWATYTSALTTTSGSTSSTVASAGAIAAGEAIKSTNVPPGTTVGAISGTTITLAIPPITLPGSLTTGVAQIGGLPSTTGLVGATISSPYFATGVTVLSITTAAVRATGSDPGVPGVVVTSAAPTSMPGQSGQVVAFDFARTGNAVTTTGADAAATYMGQDILITATTQLERSFDGGSTWVICNVGGGGQLAQFANFSSVSVTFGEPEKQMLYRLNTTTYGTNTGLTLNYRISETGAAAESLAVATPI